MFAGFMQKWFGIGGAILLSGVAVWLLALGLGGSAAAFHGFCCWLF